VYAFHIPYLGYISIYAKTPLGIAVVCGVLIVLILLNFIPDILEEDKKKNLNTE
jgi:signal peptidase